MNSKDDMHCGDVQFMKVLSEEDKESKKLANDAESLARAVDAAVEDAKKTQGSALYPLSGIEWNELTWQAVN